MQTAREITAEQFLEIPERDDTRGLQLIDGELVMSDPDMRHNVVQVRLIVALSDWLRAGAGRGRVCLPLDVLMDARNIFEPDVSWYSQARMPPVHAPRPYPVPDLAVEVRSPSTWVYDISSKRSHYERRGLGELWLADTVARQMLIFRRSSTASPEFDVALELGRGEVLTSPALAGFELALGELFEGLGE